MESNLNIFLIISCIVLCLTLFGFLFAMILDSVICWIDIKISLRKLRKDLGK